MLGFGTLHFWISFCLSGAGAFHKEQNISFEKYKVVRWEAFARGLPCLGPSLPGCPSKAFLNPICSWRLGDPEQLNWSCMGTEATPPSSWIALRLSQAPAETPLGVPPSTGPANSFGIPALLFGLLQLSCLHRGTLRAPERWLPGRISRKAFDSWECLRTEVHAVAGMF